MCNNNYMVNGEKMNKISYWPNHPLFIFQFMFLPILIAVLDLYFLYSSNVDTLEGVLTLLGFISLIIVLLFSHKIDIEDGKISGPGKFRIIKGEEIPLNEVEISTKKRFCICPYIVVKHKKSDKEIYIAQMDFTKSTIESIKNLIQSKNS